MSIMWLFCHFYQRRCWMYRKNSPNRSNNAHFVNEQQQDTEEENRKEMCGVKSNRENWKCNMPARDVIEHFANELIKSIFDWCTCNSAFLSTNSSYMYVCVSVWVGSILKAFLFPQCERRTRAHCSNIHRNRTNRIEFIELCFMRVKEAIFHVFHFSSASSSSSPAFLSLSLHCAMKGGLVGW